MRKKNILGPLGPSVLLPTDTPPEILDFEKYFFISKGKQREVGPLQISPPLKNLEKTFQGGVSVGNRTDLENKNHFIVFLTIPSKYSLREKMSTFQKVFPKIALQP